LNFAVGPHVRRQGVGAQMVRRLIDKLSQQRRKEIVLDVRESNLGAQLFFKTQAFRAVSVLRNYYEDTTEDAYSMQYTLHPQDDIYSPFAPKNRISEYDAA
jgi:ribosomal-protein-alanine N-acetyltransferase